MLFNIVVGKQCSQHSPAGGCGKHHSRTGPNDDDNDDQYGSKYDVGDDDDDEGKNDTDDYHDSCGGFQQTDKL